MATMALGSERSGRMTSEQRMVIFASSLGTVFEWYDFYIYGTLAAVLAGKEGFTKFGSTLANTLGFGTQPRTSPDVPQLGAVQPGVAPTTHHRRDWGILRVLLLAVAAAVVLLALAKVLIRGSRFLTRDPRRLAGASG